MLMKWARDDFILHRLFVDDMSTAPTSDHLKEEFMALYLADLNITGRDLMQLFRVLGLDSVWRILVCFSIQMELDAGVPAC